MRQIGFNPNVEPIVIHKIIAVDFDGTLCENKYPNIGEPNLELFQYLKEEKKTHDAKLILWTCRNGDLLNEAVLWCKFHGLRFDAVNENLQESISRFNGDTRKIFADEYIDDRAITKFKLPYKKKKRFFIGFI